MDATDLDDPMQTCPYDKSHRILKSRMQFHLVRCRKNHPANKDQLRTCPFDAVHVVNSIEYEVRTLDLEIWDTRGYSI